MKGSVGDMSFDGAYFPFLKQTEVRFQIPYFVLDPLSTKDKFAEFQILKYIRDQLSDLIQAEEAGSVCYPVEKV
jgi:hypothetical protein